jgi:hypothetical protein
MRMRFSGFLPKSSSKIVFVVAMAGYGVATATLLRAIANVLGAALVPMGVLLRRGYPGLEILTLLLLAPVFESLLLIGIFELAGWFRSPPWLQVVLAGTISTCLEAPPVSHAIGTAPAWFIMTGAYLIWRRVSWKTGFIVIASIHALLNLNSAIWTIGYALHHSKT